MPPGSYYNKPKYFIEPVPIIMPAPCFAQWVGGNGLPLMRHEGVLCSESHKKFKLENQTMRQGKTDLRVIRTKKAIRDAFCAMIMEMDYPDITIKELTQRAMINRNTFYLHYDSMDALLQELQDADIFMVNNEFPFSNRGEPMEDKQFTFCCDPKYVKALNEMGVDIVSLANNHTLDYGRDALSDTFTTLDGAGILYAGAGETKERAYELQIIEKNGKKFGFLAASRVVPESNWKVEERTPGMLTAYDDTKLVQLIKEARSGCDFLSVYIYAAPAPSPSWAPRDSCGATWG